MPSRRSVLLAALLSPLLRLRPARAAALADPKKAILAICDVPQRLISIQLALRYASNRKIGYTEAARLVAEMRKDGLLRMEGATYVAATRLMDDAAAPLAPTARRAPEWTGPFGWVYFTVRLWQVYGSWRFSLHDLPGHEPSATGGQTYSGREDAYGRAVGIIEAAGYPVSPGFRTLRRGPDAWRPAASDMGTVEYFKIGSLTRREVANDIA